MFYEFRFCYAKTKELVQQYNKKELGFDFENEKIIINIAYHIFFMGIGSNSDSLIVKSMTGICDQNFITELLQRLHVLKTQRRKAKKPVKFTVKLTDNPNVLEYEPDYIPFGGHISRLGHYFRHLYQTVKMISEQENEIFPIELKRSYAKTLRAQLSDYEQLLLFYNVNSTLGNAWILGETNFIKEYRMIKNMPIPLADFGIIPHEIFKDDISYWNDKNKSFFEWDERKNNS